jgi:hypothetical protein
MNPYQLIERRHILIQLLGGEYSQYIPNDKELNKWPFNNDIFYHKNNHPKNSAKIVQNAFSEYIKTTKNSKNKTSLGKAAWLHALEKINQNKNSKNNKTTREYKDKNYNKIISNNKTTPSMNKVIKYAELWLNKNLKNIKYKQAALIIHPDKGNIKNKNNQAKRVALFKLLGQSRA